MRLLVIAAALALFAAARGGPTPDPLAGLPHPGDPTPPGCIVLALPTTANETYCLWGPHSLTLDKRGRVIRASLAVTTTLAELRGVYGPPRRVQRGGRVAVAVWPGATALVRAPTTVTGRSVVFHVSLSERLCYP